MGCAVSAVSNHENAINGIRAPTAALYADILNVTPQWLLYGDGESAGIKVASALVLTALPNGKARLEINMVMPMARAIQVAAMAQGDEK